MAGHGAPPPSRPLHEVRVQSRLFLFLGSAIGCMSLLYLVTDDDAGQMMLGVTSLLALTCGVWLWLQVRKASTVARDVATDDDDDDGAVDVAASSPYLPHASIWPFWIGVAAFLIGNGLVLGTWFLVPGGVILLLALIGFIRQSRARA